MSQTQSDLPEEVTDLVASIACSVRVVKGPSGIALLGRRSPGGSWAWVDARCAEQDLFGDPHLRIGPSYKAAVISRLRRLADEEALITAMHPMSSTGRVIRNPGSRDQWQHITSDRRTVTNLGGPQSTVAVVVPEADTPPNTFARLGLSPASGGAIRVYGTLVDAHLGYANVLENPLRLVVPCKPGDIRDVIVVLEREQGLDVLGFRLDRPVASSQPRLRPIGSAYRRNYYPVWGDLSNKKKLRVLKLPD